MAYEIKQAGRTLYCPAVVLKIETKELKTKEQVVALFERINMVIQEAFEDYPEIQFNYLDPEHDSFPKHWEEFASDISGTWE